MLHATVRSFCGYMTEVFSITRYFEGVQNDKSRQGELFGIKVRRGAFGVGSGGG